MLPLLEQFALTSVDDTHFVAAASRETHIRSYGGQIIAQALLAAGRTVEPDRLCHSLHGYFLRPGSTQDDMQLETEIVRDGRSFSMRHVQVRQNSKHLFSLMTSFHRDEPGGEHQSAMPTVLAPETLPSFSERFAGRESHDDVGRWFDRLEAFDVRFVGPTPLDVEPESGRSQFWVRFIAPLPDSPLMHQAALAYMSDMFILDPIFLEHGTSWTKSKVLGASLDHAMWFHNDFDAGEWLLFDQESSISAHSRGLARAQVWSRDGRLIATVEQEALLRPPHGSDNGQ
jgi:acyl-CoA thioesterase-2